MSYLIFLLQHVSQNAGSVYNAVFQILRFKFSVLIITLDVFQQFFSVKQKTCKSIFILIQGASVQSADSNNKITSQIFKQILVLFFLQLNYISIQHVLITKFSIDQHQMQVIICRFSMVFSEPVQYALLLKVYLPRSQES